MIPAALRGEVHDIPYKDPQPANASKSQRETIMEAYRQEKNQWMKRSFRS